MTDSYELIDVVLVAFAITALAIGTDGLADPELPPSLRMQRASELLCVPERLSICNGMGECYADDRPETLASWKFDVPGKRLAMCKRDGRECTDWIPLASVDDSLFLVIHDSGPHPETFKIDRDTGKFAAVRISGDVDVREVRIIQRTGTCFVTKQE